MSRLWCDPRGFVFREAFLGFETEEAIASVHVSLHTMIYWNNTKDTTQRRRRPSSTRQLLLAGCGRNGEAKDNLFKRKKKQFSSAYCANRRVDVHFAKSVLTLS
jgi:hypothetical protein